MIVCEAGHQVELRDSSLGPRLFATLSILWGSFLVAWAIRLMATGHQAAGGAVAWMMALGLFGAILSILMLRCFPRARLVVDRNRDVMCLDQWALGRHARAEWPLVSIAGVGIAQGLDYYQYRRPWSKGSYRLQVMLRNGETILPTPRWSRRAGVESAARAIGSALGVGVTWIEGQQRMGFPDRTLFNSDMRSRS